MIVSSTDTDSKDSLSAEILSYRKLGVVSWKANMPWWIILSTVGFNRVGEGENEVPRGHWLYERGGIDVKSQSWKYPI